MIDDTLLDVACPFCPAQPLELCTVGGRYMESTVHGPRRVRAGVVIHKEPAPRADPTKCRQGRHAWVAENIHTALSGQQHCLPCRDARRRSRDGSGHQYNGNHCRKGHEYTAENTYNPPKGGPRRCIACRELQRKRAKA